MTEITPGIYLEVKKGQIGTGHTAKDAEYRNFWITLSQNDREVECLLLDHEFGLTGVRENIPVADFSSGRLTFVPQGEKKYQALLIKLARKTTQGAARQKDIPATPVTPTDPVTPAPPTKNQPRKWWEEQPKDIKPGDIFKKSGDVPGGAKKKNGGSGSGKNWWEK